MTVSNETLRRLTGAMNFGWRRSKYAKFDPGKHPKDEKGRWTERRSVVSDVFDGEIGEDFREKAMAWSRRELVGKSFTNAATGMKVGVTVRSIKKTLNHLPDKRPGLALSILPELIEKAVLDHQEPDRHDTLNVKAWHYLKVALQIDGQPHVTTLKVREDANGVFYYDQNVSLQTKVAPPCKLGAADESAVTPAGGAKNSIDRDRSSGKQDSGEPDKYSAQRGLFDESQHPRGQPDNAGEFAPKQSVSGQQQGLFDRGEFTSGQKSLFNVVRPSQSASKSKSQPHEALTAKLNARTREFLAKKETVSPADLGIPLQQDSLPGQRALFSRWGWTEQYGQRSFEWTSEDEQKHPRDDHGRWAHTMSRGEFHQQEKQKPEYDVTVTNKTYWAAVKSAALEGKEIHPKADEEHKQIFGEAVPRGVAQSSPEPPNKPTKADAQKAKDYARIFKITPKQAQEAVARGIELSGWKPKAAGDQAKLIARVDGKEVVGTIDELLGKESPPGQAATAPATQSALPGLEPEKPSETPVAAKLRASIKKALVEDFGEKIGGARKDNARPLGSRGTKTEDANDERPAWARRYDIAQIEKSSNKAEEGKWSITDKKDTDWMGQPKQKGGVFNSKAEAEAALPLIAVSRNHRVNVIKGNIKDGNREFGIVRNITDRKRAVVKGGFKSEDEANRYMASHAAEVIEHQFPRYEDYAYLDHVERQGPEHKTPGANVTPADFQKAFQFRGGEFGNWQSGKDGVTSLNHAYDALHDLSDALGLPAKAVALNGDLAIAFGARGTGGKNSARAHYEPDARVMNLTKMKGAGSLAHEWSHALDWHLGSGHHAISNPNYKTKLRPEVAEAAKALRNAMNGKQIDRAVQAPKAEADEVAELRSKYPNAEPSTLRIVGPTTVAGHLHNLKGGMNDARRWKSERAKKPVAPLSDADNKEWDDLSAKIANGDVGPSMIDDGGRQTYEHVDQLNKLFKKHAGRSFHTGNWQNPSAGHYLVSNIERKQLMEKRAKEADAGVVEKRTVPTEFAAEAAKLDSTQVGNYYSLPHEMFARAFEAYVADKLHEKGIRSDYLVSRGKTDNRAYAMFDMKPFPEGDERKSINAAFDNFFAALKHQPRQDDKGSHVQLYSRLRERMVYAMRGAVAKYGWDESKHPRGQPENKGEFASSPGSAGSSSTPSADHSTLKLQFNDAFRQWIGKARHKPGEREAQHEQREQWNRLVDETLNTDHAQPVERLSDSELAPPEAGERPGLMKVDQIHVDPSRFQYKLNTDDSGVTKQFDDVEKFNPMLSGTIHVWTDPADGKTYVVNGHHRYELAQRTGFSGDLQVYHLNAQDSQQARALGALINIAGGQGTSVDAAKFMRDTGSTIDELKKYGISPSGQVAKEGTILAKLSPRLFDKVTQGLFDKNRAVAIASHVENPDDQDKLAQHIDKYEERTGREASDGAVAQMAKKMALSGRRQHTEKNLFGEEEFDDPTFVERAELESAIRRDIAARASKFAAVSTTKAANVLEGRNTIDAGANKSEADRLRQLLDDFDRETSYSGPVSDAFNDAARRLADAPRKRNELVKELGLSIPGLLASQADRRAEASAIQPSGASSGSGPVEEPKPVKPLAGQKDFFARLRSGLMLAVERYASQRA